MEQLLLVRDQLRFQLDQVEKQIAELQARMERNRPQDGFPGFKFPPYAFAKQTKPSVPHNCRPAVSQPDGHFESGETDGFPGFKYPPEDYYDPRTHPRGHH
jgi:hypothetical protein